jgi:hypothetical protein
LRFSATRIAAGAMDQFLRSIELLGLSPLLNEPQGFDRGHLFHIALVITLGLATAKLNAVLSHWKHYGTPVK